MICLSGRVSHTRARAHVHIHHFLPSQMLDNEGECVGMLKMTLEFMLERVATAFVTCTGVTVGDTKRIGRSTSPQGSRDARTRTSDNSPATPAQRPTWPKGFMVTNASALPRSIVNAGSPPSRPSDRSTFHISDSSVEVPGLFASSYPSGLIPSPVDSILIPSIPADERYTTPEESPPNDSGPEHLFEEEVVTLEESIPPGAFITQAEYEMLKSPGGVVSIPSAGNHSIPAVDTIITEILSPLESAEVLSGSGSDLDRPADYEEEMSPSGAQMAIVSGGSGRFGGNHGIDPFAPVGGLGLRGQPQVVVPLEPVFHKECSPLNGMETAIVLTPIRQARTSDTPPTGMENAPATVSDTQVLSSIGLGTERSRERDQLPQSLTSIDATVFASGAQESEPPLGELGSVPVPTTKPVIYNIASLDPSITYGKLICHCICTHQPASLSAPHCLDSPQ